MLTDPLPIWLDNETQCFVFLAPGPLLFTLPTKHIGGNLAVVAGGPDDAHPYGVHTQVRSLHAAETRALLARAVVFETGSLGPRLSLWENFCEEVVTQLESGRALDDALRIWKLADGDDLSTDD